MKNKWVIADLSHTSTTLTSQSQSVKEQRVDGSCFGYKPELRCTLVGGESRYRFIIPSKQLNVKKKNFFYLPLTIHLMLILGFGVVL
jgi:hypothetical protein